MKSVWTADNGLLCILIAVATLNSLDGSDTNCSMGLSHGLVVTYCANHGLQDLPADIHGQTEVLILMDNHISRITDQFQESNCDAGDESLFRTRFPYMIQLDMSSNQLYDMSPHSLFGMKQLRTVVLRHNLLKTLHRDTFVDNKLLHFIDLSENKINSLEPEIFKDLEVLQFLNLGNNWLHNLHCDTFKGLRKLEVLLINSNFITNFDSNLFRDLGELTSLRIDQNRLKYLAKDLLSNLLTLASFNASNNDISFLNTITFSNNGRLKNVDLSHNCISKISRYLVQDLVKMNTVNFSFNCLESLFLSNIPVTLTDTPKHNELVTKYDMCSDHSTPDIPCFISELTYPWSGENFFHEIDFSFNNISKIIFNKYAASHSLEFLKLSLAGNYGLRLPILWLNREKYIVTLNFDHLNFNWRNFTLVNEILQLPLLKSFSIVGCEACEFYMKLALYSIFNPNHRVSIICGSLHQQDETGTTNSVSSSFMALPNIQPEDLLPDNNSSYNCADRRDVAEEADYLCDYLCECLYKKTRIMERLLSNILNTTCKYTMDCAYLSLDYVPKVDNSMTCILMSHNNIEVIEENHFRTSWELKFLDLSFNNLSRLPCRIFHSLYKLQFLKLNNNHLLHLDATLFSAQINLGILLLHDNKISSYDPETFTVLQELQALSIDFTNLVQFHNKTFSKLSKLMLFVIRATSNCSTPPTVLKHFENLRNLLSCTITGFNLNSTIEYGFLQSNILQKIVFEENLLSVLSADLFASVINLKMVTLRLNKIKEIDKDAFKYLNNLVHLDISYNMIDYLHNELFFTTIELQFLNISHNKLFCVPARIFESLTKLEYLDLSDNNIAEWDLHMFIKLSFVHNIYLQNNYIGRSNDAILRQSDVYMDMHMNLNSSTNISPGLSKCFENNYTTLQNNREVNDNVTILTNKSKLTLINIANNNISKIKNHTFGVNPLLKYLYISHCNINYIDNEAFNNMLHLQVIALHHNCISNINRNLFRNLSELQSLLLNNNHLEFIEEDAFLHLSSLKVLALNANRLIVFDFALLSNANSLEIMTLNDNYLMFHNTTLYHPSLKNLHLSNNPLANTTSELIYFMPSLVELDLSNTSMCMFHKYSFQNLWALRFLNLGANCLGGLSYRQFSSLQNLFFLNVSVPLSGNRSASWLDWRSITLINHWFSMPELDYLIISGHPICEEPQWTQIISYVFLSEKWIHVICSYNFRIPTFSVSLDGTKY